MNHDADSRPVKGSDADQDGQSVAQPAPPVGKLLSDEELAEAFAIIEDRGPGVYWSLIDKMTGAIRAHIDALTAQRDRARDIAVSLEQELAEVADLVRWRDNQRDPGAGQVIAEFDAVAKAALRDTTTITAWNATPAGSLGRRRVVICPCGAPTPPEWGTTCWLCGGGAE